MGNASKGLIFEVVFVILSVYGFMFMCTEALSAQSPEAKCSQILNGSTFHRRSFTSRTLAILFVPLLNFPQESEALQKKNEALCDTGFFEHIYEYRCTAIGDISDEAKSKVMDDKMKNSADLLMEKLGLTENDVQSTERNRFDKVQNDEIYQVKIKDNR